MTRINANIPMVKLSDQLLLNELGEITRILTSVEQRILADKSFSDIPENFTLGTGHMKFFFNKCEFIWERYLKLRYEYTKRHDKNYSFEHFNESERRYFAISGTRPDLCNNWTATEEDNNIVLNRIFEKSKTYKKQHTYCGETINNWEEFLWK